MYPAHTSRKEWQALMKRARAGDAAAQWEVGMNYEEGALDPETNKTIARADLDKAQHWFLLAAEQDYVHAQVSLARLLSGTPGITPDFKAAIAWSKKAIKQDSGYAASNLGRIYRDLQKPARAFRYYRKAAALGDADALLDIGLCHWFGFGTAKDPVAARDCFRKLLDADHTYPRSIDDAHYWLAICELSQPKRRKSSLIKARTLLETANQDGDHEPARDLLRVIGDSRFFPA